LLFFRDGSWDFWNLRRILARKTRLPVVDLYASFGDTVTVHIRAHEGCVSCRHPTEETRAENKCRDLSHLRSIVCAGKRDSLTGNADFPIGGVRPS
jgi:hypothetical protein